MENKTKEFKNLEKWQGTLANCIRCGYCFEHCPMFKHTGWESDAPRAKIITAYGLLSGDVEPTEAAADKMFSCFYCKRCEAACSSGVLVDAQFWRNMPDDLPDSAMSRRYAVTSPAARAATICSTRVFSS